MCWRFLFPPVIERLEKDGYLERLTSKGDFIWYTLK